jgi:hypothetical protein
MTRCEIRVTNRGEDSNVLADRVDEIARDLLCGLCREFSCKLSDDGKTYTVSFNVEDVPGLPRKEFEDELREMAEDETDSVIYSYSIS